jgi:hypothetical protein
VQSLFVGQWSNVRRVADLIDELDRFEGMRHCKELVGVYRVSQETWLEVESHFDQLNIRTNVCDAGDEQVS